MVVRQDATAVVRSAAQQVGCPISHMARADKKSASLNRARKLAAWVLTQDYGLTQAETAQALGRSRAAVAVLLRSLKDLMTEKPKVARQYEVMRSKILEDV